MNSQRLLNEQHRWFNSTAGQYLQVKEQALYDQAVVDLFGFNALQMGCLQLDLLRNSRIPNRFRASENNMATQNNHLCCHDDFLPFAAESLDLLLLPHRLEFSSRPHQTLREAERVVMHEGYLIISGFNPFSLWGTVACVKRLFSANKAYPWSGQFIGLARMKDWLALMGFEVVSVEVTCCIPPFERASWYKHCIFLDNLKATMFGGIYFIVAKKRVACITPVRPLWKSAVLTPHLISRPAKKNR